MKKTISLIFTLAMLLSLCAMTVYADGPSLALGSVADVDTASAETNEVAVPLKVTPATGIAIFSTDATWTATEGLTLDRVVANGQTTGEALVNGNRIMYVIGATGDPITPAEDGTIWTAYFTYEKDTVKTGEYTVSVSVKDDLIYGADINSAAELGTPFTDSVTFKITAGDEEPDGGAITITGAKLTLDSENLGVSASQGTKGTATASGDELAEIVLSLTPTALSETTYTITAEDETVTFAAPEGGSFAVTGTVDGYTIGDITVVEGGKSVTFTLTAQGEDEITAKVTTENIVAATPQIKTTDDGATITIDATTESELPDEITVDVYKGAEKIGTVTVAKSTDSAYTGSAEIDGKTYDVTVNVAQEITYDVTFVSEHGTVPATQKVKAGEKAEKPDDLTDDRYTFDGWYADSEYKITFDFNTAINENTSVYAKWTAKKVTITVEPSTYGTIDIYAGKDKLTDLSVDYGTQITVEATPAFGYQLDTLKRDGANIQNKAVITVNGDITISATFSEAPKFAVTFTVASGETKVAGAKVQFAYNGEKQALTTGEDGTIASEAMVAGTYSYVVSADKYEVKSGSFTITNEALSVKVELTAVSTEPAEGGEIDTSTTAEITEDGTIEITTTIEATAEDIAAAIDEAVVAAAGDPGTGAEATEAVVTIDASIKANEEVSKTEVSLPAAVINALAAGKTETTTDPETGVETTTTTKVSAAVVTDQGTITLPAAALSELAGGNATLTVETQAVEEDEQKAVTDAITAAIEAGLTNQDGSAVDTVKSEDLTDNRTITSKISVSFENELNIAVEEGSEEEQEYIELELYIGKRAWSRNPQLFYYNDTTKKVELMEGERSATPGFYKIKSRHLSDFYVYSDSTPVVLESFGTEAGSTVFGANGKYREIMLDGDVEDLNNLWATILITTGSTEDTYAVSGISTQVTSTTIPVEYNAAATSVKVLLTTGRPDLSNVTDSLEGYIKLYDSTNN